MLDNLNSNFESSKAQRPDANDDEVEIDLLEILLHGVLGEVKRYVWLYMGQTL